MLLAVLAFFLVSAIFGSRRLAFWLLRRVLWVRCTAGSSAVICALPIASSVAWRKKLGRARAHRYGACKTLASASNRAFSAAHA